MPADTASQRTMRQRPRAAASAAEMQALPRRRIHGGGTEAPVRHAVAIETTTDAPSSKAPRIRRSNWRATLVGILVGLLIVMVPLLKWLLEFQVTAAAERRLQETAARTAAARCFELKAHGATNACLKDLEIKSNPVD